MKKFMSTLLVFATLSCFTMTVGSFANNSTFLDKIKSSTTYGLGKAWNSTKHSAISAWDDTTYGLEKFWNVTKYGAEKTWNGTKFSFDTAWDWTKDTTISFKDWFVNVWCEYVKLGCQNNINLNVYLTSTEQSTNSENSEETPSLDNDATQGNIENSNNNNEEL